MLTAVLLIFCALAQAPGPGVAPPDSVQRIVLLELDSVAPPDRPYTRYLDLSDIPVGVERDRIRKRVDFAANGTSWRPTFGHAEPVAAGRLLRIDLRQFGWDYASRWKRLRELESRGVRFDLRDAEARRLFLDPWEQLARLDPFFVTGDYEYGHYVRGWLDPAVTAALRRATYSCKPVLRASWVLPRLLTEKKFGGIYSDLLMIPPKEADFYKSLLIDIRRFEGDNYLLRGGAVLGGGPDGVALHNRELQLFPSPYGPSGTGYYWRTFDVNVDARGEKSVLESFRGTLRHDGREAIGTLPNGLHWYRLDDGKGNQAADVPPDIAQVKETPAGLPVRDVRVINAYGCIRCHAPSNGIYPFSDVVRRIFLAPQANLVTKYRDEAAVLEDYYASDLGRIIERQRADYAESLRAACGMTGAEAVGIVGAIEQQIHDPVTPERAAAELGYPADAARVYWLAAALPHKTCGCQYPGSPHLAILATGQPIRRAAWEQSAGDAYRAILHPWEQPAGHPPPPKGP